MMKRYIAMALLSVLLLLGGGCSMENSAGTKQQKLNDAALIYMEQTYGEKFSYIGPWGSSYTTPGIRQILVSCDALPGKEILVLIKGDGKELSYSDNYMDFYFESQTKAYVENVASHYFDNYTVTIDIVRFSSAEGVLPTTKFEDYLSNLNNLVRGSIDIADADEKTLRVFLGELKELGVHFWFGIDISSTKEGFTAKYLADSNEVVLNRRGLQ